MTTETIDPRLRKALAARLGFRSAFLSTVGTVEDRSIPFELKKTWTASLQSLPGIKSELQLARQVPEAFSAKLQRKHASSVPPRPVVTVAFEDAYQHLERLCNDGLIVTEVLNFHDSHSLMVSRPPFASLGGADRNRTSCFTFKKGSHNHQSTSVLFSSTTSLEA